MLPEYEIKISESNLAGRYCDDWAALFKEAYSPMQLKLDEARLTDTLPDWFYTKPASYKVLIDSLPVQQRQAVLLGDLNYMVEQYGFSEWIVNGCAGYIDEILVLLRSIPGPNVLKAVDILQEVQAYLQPSKWTQMLDSRVVQEPVYRNYSYSGVYMQYQSILAGYTPGGEPIYNEFVNEIQVPVAYRERYPVMLELTLRFRNLKTFIPEVGAYFMMLQNPVA
jgi:hypothetical protein